jgi:hypothetical protein
MATDDAPAKAPAAIVALAARVDDMRARLQRMHADLRDGSDPRTDHQARVQALGTSTLELLDAQARLRAMRVTHRQQQVADLLERDRRRERTRLWQLTGGVLLAATLVVLLAASGAIPAARLAIGVPTLLAGAAMAASMTPWIASQAGAQGIDLRKAVPTAGLALLALVGALAWPPLGYAGLPALAVAAVPLVAADQTRRRRATRPRRDGRRG